ncbi:MAG: YdcF family protein [Candidatus Woesearchaeota archaeon]
MRLLIVLGGGITEDHELNTHTKERYDKAVELQEHYDSIVCSTDKSYRKLDEFRDTTEARIGKNYLLKRGVPEEKILLEEKSRDTFSNAYFCRKEIVDPLEAKELTVLTSEFHMPKTQYVFKLVFPENHYDIGFIASANGTVDRKQLQSRKISESLVLSFYKNALTEHYRITPGDMASIKNYMFEYNPAFTGKADKHHKRLTEEITTALQEHENPLY